MKMNTTSGLSSAIMSLPCSNSEALSEWFDMPTAYKCGHRDARHAAAELVDSRPELQADGLLALTRYSESCMEGGGVAPDASGEFIKLSDVQALADKSRDYQSELQSMRSAFHINMMRAFPDKTHDEITAEIDKACGTEPRAPSQPRELTDADMPKIRELADAIDWSENKFSYSAQDRFARDIARYLANF